MKKYLLAALLTIVTAGCGEDVVHLTDLTPRVSDLERRANLNDQLDALVSQLNVDIAGLQAAQLATESDVTSLQIQLSQEGVKLFKCNNVNSSERIMKINGYFYAAMNRVTTEIVQVVTGSSDQTFTTPDMCETWNGILKLPNSGGQCTPNGGPFASTLIPGSSVVVPSYTTKTITVVKSVEIALDILTDGSYITTDGSTNCPFSVSNGGTISSGLIPVQGGN